MDTAQVKPPEQDVASVPAPATQPAPGWYPDPSGPGQRYWDGTRWGEQYPAPPQRRRGGAGRWIVALVLVAVAGLAVVALLVAGGGGTSNEAGRKAVNAAHRLDDTMTNIFNRTDPTVSITFGCLSQASNINPYGGPRLARCVPVAERSSALLHRASVRLAAAFRSSPRDVRRLYAPAQRTEQQVLAVHKRYVDAMAQWARVHGASSYAGAAEFGAIRTARASVIAVDRKYHRAMDQARRRWKRYAEQKWNVRYR